MEFIKVPFGYVLDWLCQFSGSYGIALILFSLLIKLILLPASMKSKKSMLKMSRLAPQLKALEIQCGDDKAKYQQEASKLYKSEGVSMFGGCLWSLLPLLLLFPLYYCIREPITYLLHFTAEDAKEIVEIIGRSVKLGSNTYYQQLEAAAYIPQFKDAIIAAMPEAAEKLHEINFNFLGLNLASIPQWKFWEFFGAEDGLKQLGLFVVPLLSAGSQFLSMLVSQKMSNKVATNEKGEADADAAESANKSNRTMTMLMPAMSLYFCFIMPCAISIYWIAQALFGTIQEYVLTKHYRRIYEAEDAIKREKAAEEAAKEAERERIRRERREKYGEEGVFDPNTSMKKRKQQANAEAKAAADAYAAAQAAKNTPAEQEPAEEDSADKHFSGIAERPYCRGRNYKASRYGRKDDSVSE